MSIKFKYDAVYCEFQGFETLTGPIIHRIQNTLSYKDSKIDYQNKMGNMYMSHRNPIVSLLDNNNRFYTGLLPRVAHILDKQNVSYELESIIPSKPDAIYNKTVLPEWLYDHQFDIIRQSIDIKRGLVESPTGSGKSISIAYLLKFFSQDEVIITVPQQNLLKQLADTLEEVLCERIGRISGDSKTYRRITVGVINSLAKAAKEGMHDFSKVDVLICDETHRVGANFYQDLCNACVNTKYRLGFSGTIERQTGDERVMEGLLGPKFIKINEVDLIEQGILSEIKYLTIPFQSTKLTYKKYDGRTNTYRTKNRKPDRAEVYKKNITTNMARNLMICDVIETYLNSKPKLPMLTFIQYIEHGKEIQNLLKARGLDIQLVYGKTKKESRALIKQLLNNEVEAAIVSSIFNEGINILQLFVGLNAGGGSSGNRVRQQIGRMIRKYEGKPYGVMIDIADDEPYYLGYNYQIRQEVVDRVYPNRSTRLTYQQLIAAASNGFQNL